MVRYQYPAELWDEYRLDKRRILTLIMMHEAYSADVLWTLKSYYEGEQAIDERTKAAGVANNKVMVNHAKDISDTATGYFMGSPITYTNSDNADIEPLLVAFDKAEIDDVDAEIALDASIYGAGYEYVYAADGEAEVRSKAVSPLSTFLIVDDTIEENELAGVYYYQKRNDADATSEYVALVSTQNLTYTLNISGTIARATQPVWAFEEPQEHYFGEPQIIEYLNNKNGIGDFAQQISLMDAYNALSSDRLNDVDNFVDAILVLYGTVLGDTEEETDEARKELAMKKLLELPADGKAEYLSRQLEESGVEIIRKALKEDIYTMSHVPNFTDENFAGNASGVAMEYKLLALEMMTKLKERYFKKGLRKRIRMYCNFLGLKQILLQAGSIMPTMSRSLPKNLVELSQVVANLSGHVSEETLIKQLPFVEDVEYELEKVDKAAETKAGRQQAMFGRLPQVPLKDEKTPEYVRISKDEGEAV